MDRFSLCFLYKEIVNVKKPTRFKEYADSCDWVIRLNHLGWFVCFCLRIL